MNIRFISKIVFMIVLLTFATSAFACNAPTLILSKGSKDRTKTGNQVTQLQNALVELGYMKGEPTGKYDDATKNAVKSFQAASGFKKSWQNGSFGKQTRIKLQEVCSEKHIGTQQNSQQAQFSKSDGLPVSSVAIITYPKEGSVLY